MVENLLTVFGQVVTLFLMMGVGFLLGKLGKLSHNTLSQMSFLLLYLVSPCIMIECFQVDATPQLLIELGQGAVITLACYGLYIIISKFLFRRQTCDDRDSLQFSVVYGNIGFMGVPLVQSILGSNAMIYGAISLAAFNLYSWTHGVVTMGGKKAISPKNVFINPGVIGIVVSLALFLTGIAFPAPIKSTVSFLADLNTPLAMVVIGGQMASANLSMALRRPTLYTASAVKLIIIPAVTALALLPLNLSPALYGATILLSAAPTAGITSMFAQQFGRDTTTASQTITLSTILSIFTLPIFAVIVKSI